jgi:hypothetical protein
MLPFKVASHKAGIPYYCVIHYSFTLDDSENYIKEGSTAKTYA